MAAVGSVPAAGGAAASSSTLSVGKRIEFIHFGRVHRDWARNFQHDEMILDVATVDLTGMVGSRAICFRAALEREAVLLAGIAHATQAALAERQEKEGATADLLTAVLTQASMTGEPLRPGIVLSARSSVEMRTVPPSTRTNAPL